MMIVQPLRSGNASFQSIACAPVLGIVYNQLFFVVYVQDFVDTSDVVHFVNAVSPDFAHYLAPVDPSKIAVELGAMAAD